MDGIIKQENTGHFTDLEHRGIGCLYFLFGSLGVLSNSFIVKVFIRDSTVAAPKKVLHINLCISNILVCLWFPFAGLSCFRGRWVFDAFGCQAYGVGSYTAGYAAVGFVIALCVERYIAVQHTDFYNSTSALTWWMMAFGVWTTALLWALFPLFGWSSYVPEASGVACGLNLFKKDYSHMTYGAAIMIGSIFLFAIAAVCLSGAKPTKPIIVRQDDGWMNDNQLRWLCLSFFMFSLIGWGPYGIIVVWSLMSPASEATMLAASLPPLFAKACTALYPVAYLLASEKIREQVIGGFFTPDGATEKKSK